MWEAVMSDYAEVRGDYLRRGFASRIGWGARPAVLVIDLTSGFTDPTTPLGADLSDVIAATNRILEIARPAAMPIIFTSIAYADPAVEGGHWVRKIPALEILREGTPLVEVDPHLGRRPNEPVIIKRFASAFAGTSLYAMLQMLRVDTLVLCGTSTSGCIRASAVDAPSARHPQDRQCSERVQVGYDERRLEILGGIVHGLVDRPGPQHLTEGVHRSVVKHDAAVRVAFANLLELSLRQAPRLHTLAHRSPRARWPYSRLASLISACRVQSSRTSSGRSMMMPCLRHAARRMASRSSSVGGVHACARARGER
jgi:nicotinamidase-related amidase